MATAEWDDIERILRRHKRFWNVSYHPALPRQDLKASKARACALFRLHYFGGILLVLGRSFTIKTVAQAAVSVGWATSCPPYKVIKFPPSRQ